MGCVITPVDGHMTVAALILAAGQGSRFGSDKRLASMPDGRAMLEASIQAYVGICQPVWVVIRAGDSQAGDLVLAQGARPLICADADLGMGHSLATGAKALLSEGGCEGVIIGMADMPLVQRATVQTLQQVLLREQRPVAPVCQGRMGQPRGVPAALLPALTGLTGDLGARQLIDWRQTAVPVPVDDAGVLLDVDTPSDFQTTAAVRGA